jgi:hypothetical protein
MALCLIGGGLDTLSFLVFFERKKEKRKGQREREREREQKYCCKTHSKRLVTYSLVFFPSLCFDCSGYGYQIPLGAHWLELMFFYVINYEMTRDTVTSSDFLFVFVVVFDRSMIAMSTPNQDQPRPSNRIITYYLASCR